MNVSDLEKLDFLTPVCVSENDTERALSGVYCCDLLSWAMSKAPADCVWITVMSNQNTLAVASLCDVAAVVLAEDAPLDQALAAKARQQGINLFRSPLPIYACARRLDELIGGVAV